MSARKIRASWWVDFRYFGKRLRIRCPEPSRTGALAFELVLRQRLARGEDLKAVLGKNTAVPLFKDFAFEWYESYALTNNKPSEQRNKMINLRKHLVPEFGNKQIDSITSLDIEEFKAKKLRSGLARKTINNQLTVLGKCLRSAEEWMMINRVPRIKFLKVAPPKFSYLSLVECRKLLSAIDHKPLFAMVLTALRTGLRCGELLGLEWADIDLERRMLVVSRAVVHGIVGTPKSNRERYIPITSDLVMILETIKTSGGRVFRWNDRVLTEYMARSWLQRYCKRAGVRKVGWHALRHTFATQLAEQGVSLRAIQELLGHSDIRMTTRYAHFSPSALQEVMKQLERAPVLEKLGQPVGNKSFSVVAA